MPCGHGHITGAKHAQQFWSIRTSIQYFSTGADFDLQRARQAALWVPTIVVYHTHRSILLLNEGTRPTLHDARHVFLQMQPEVYGSRARSAQAVHTCTTSMDITAPRSPVKPTRSTRHVQCPQCPVCATNLRIHLLHVENLLFEARPCMERLDPLAKSGIRHLLEAAHTAHRRAVKPTRVPPTDRE